MAPVRNGWAEKAGSSAAMASSPRATAEPGSATSRQRSPCPGDLARRRTRPPHHVVAAGRRARGRLPRAEGARARRLLRSRALAENGAELPDHHHRHQGEDDGGNRIERMHRAAPSAWGGRGTLQMAGNRSSIHVGEPGPTSSITGGIATVRCGSGSVKMVSPVATLWRRLPWRTRITGVLVDLGRCGDAGLDPRRRRRGCRGAVLLGLATSFVGASLARRLGRAALGGLRQTIGPAGAGLPQGAVALDSLLAGLGAVLLLLPGFLTDAIGLVLAVPGARRLCAIWIGGRGPAAAGPAGRAARPARDRPRPGRLARRRRGATAGPEGA